MSKKQGQLSKLYELARIFQYETYEGTCEDYSDYKALTEPQIEEKLHKKGIPVERKTFYKDVNLLRKCGMTIQVYKKGRQYYYYCASLPYNFEFTDLKILIDAIQSAKFISESQSNKIIKSITAIAPNDKRYLLDRDLAITGRIKSKRSSSLYNVDSIHRAIGENKKIAFDYYMWSPDKKLVKKSDKKYEVSPIALIYENERYYLVAYAYDTASDSMKQKNYRVDKIKAIDILDEDRDDTYDYSEFNPVKYINSTFNMFGSSEEEVATLEVKNECVGIFIDKFGEDIEVEAKDETTCEVTVKVNTSEQFYGWLCGISGVAKLTAPESAVASFKEYLEKIIEKY